MLPLKWNCESSTKVLVSTAAFSALLAHAISSISIHEIYDKTKKPELGLVSCNISSLAITIITSRGHDFLSLPARPLTTDLAQSKSLAAHQVFLQYLTPAWPFLHHLCFFPRRRRRTVVGTHDLRNSISECARHRTKQNLHDLYNIITIGE